MLNASCRRPHGDLAVGKEGGRCNSSSRSEGECWAWPHCEKRGEAEDAAQPSQRGLEVGRNVGESGAFTTTGRLPSRSGFQAKHASYTCREASLAMVYPRDGYESTAEILPVFYCRFLCFLYPVALLSGLFLFAKRSKSIWLLV